MNEFKPLSAEVLQELAEELAINPAFLEKDWYATQALRLLPGLNTSAFTCVFSGGTCLSKAYGLIKRFSEDLDFRVQGSEIESRSARREYVAKIIDTLTKSQLFKDIIVKKEDQSHRAILTLTYPHVFEQAQSLRPHIKVELIFSPVTLDSQIKPVQSLADQFLHNADGVFDVVCISPIETAAEKLSALLWRTLYSKQDFDPTLLRHLYDLASLKEVLRANQAQFKALLEQIYQADQSKWDNQHSFESLPQALKHLHQVLVSQPKYKKAYQSFVENMCYDTNTLSFEKALADIQDIY